MAELYETYNVITQMLIFLALIIGPIIAALEYDRRRKQKKTIILTVYNVINWYDILLLV